MNKALSLRRSLLSLASVVLIASLAGCIPTINAPSSEPQPTEPGRLITEGAEQEDIVVEVTVTTTAEGGGNIFYSTFLNQELSSERFSFEGLWSDNSTYQADPLTASFNVIADAKLLPGETLECEIVVNGVVVDSASSEGGKFFEDGLINCLYDAADAN